MTDLTTPMSHPQLPRGPRRPPISPPFPAPMRYAPPPPPFVRPKRRARLVLLIACAVAFAAAATFAGLYVAAAADRDTALARLADVRGDLTDVRGQVAAAAEEQASAEDRNDDLEAENTALNACVEAVHHYLWDGLEGAARTAAFSTMYDACQ
jgi:hypothetical protein